VGHMKPISQYILLNSSLFREDNDDISELSIVVNKNGIETSGQVFLFGLQPLKCEILPIQ
jgi:hypothetical protein